MADIFLHLGLIYAAIILICVVAYKYYFNKTHLSNEQDVKKETLSVEPTTKIPPEIIEYPKATEQSAKKEWHVIQSTFTEKAAEIIEQKESIFLIPEEKQDEISEEIKPIEKFSEDTNEIENFFNSTIHLNGNSNNNNIAVIEDPVKEYKPQLNFFSYNSKPGRRFNTGLINTTFYFGSEDGFFINNPIVDITFKSGFEYASGGITGAGIVSAGYLSKHTLDNNTRFLIAANYLQAGHHIYIEVISKKDLQIEGLKITPIDSSLLPILLQQKNNQPCY
jgi:hypothetical protein